MSSHTNTMLQFQQWQNDILDNGNKESEQNKAKNSNTSMMDVGVTTGLHWYLSLVSKDKEDHNQAHPSHTTSLPL